MRDLILRDLSPAVLIQLYYLMTVAKLEQLYYLALWISEWIVDGIGVPYFWTITITSKCLHRLQFPNFFLLLSTFHKTWCMLSSSMNMVPAIKVWTIREVSWYHAISLRLVPWLHVSPVFGRAKDGQCATSVACTARASAWWLPVGWQSCSGVRPMEICLTDVCVYNHIQASCKILRV